MSYIGILILTMIYVLMLMVYFSYVTQNLVFTHTYLAPKDVPYYDPIGTGTHPLLTQVDRFQFEWFIFATDALRIMVPTVGLLAYLYQIMHGPANTVIYTVFMAFCAIVEGAKLCYRSWEYARCGFYQLCRNDDPNGITSSANLIWMVMFFLGFGFFGMNLIYTFLGSGMQTAGQEYDISSGGDISGAAGETPVKKKRERHY
jgi:hypothetical protein